MKIICVTVSKKKVDGGRSCLLLNWEEKVLFHKSQLPASEGNKNWRRAVK